MNWSIIEIAISGALVGLIWVIQVVHYPIFFDLEDKSFNKAMLRHQQRITSIVMPLMLCELGLSIYQCIFFWDLKQGLTLGIILLIWLSTFFIQVPLHQKLLIIKNDQVINKLVQSNWIRTFLWTLKLFLILN